MVTTIASLVLAALLEVGGDAAIRRGLVRAAPAWILFGGVALIAYGFAVNANRAIDFGRLMGTYIAIFFVVSQTIAIGLFGERLSLPLVAGGVLIVLGGMVVQLGAR
jgi:drug/metabolite transporter superfamily protein YnfA